MLNPDPEKFYTLPEAFNALGHKRHDNSWTGTEIAARDLPPPKRTFHALKDADQKLDHERRAIVERAKKAAAGVGYKQRVLKVSPKVFEERRLSQVARRDETESELRTLLYGGGVPAALLNKHDGRSVDIPHTHWLANKFMVDFASGQAEWRDCEGRQQIMYQGIVLIDRRAFDQVFTDAQQTTVGAETACKKWLEARVEEWSEENGPVPNGKPDPQEPAETPVPEGSENEPVPPRKKPAELMHKRWVERAKKLKELNPDILISAIASKIRREDLRFNEQNMRSNDPDKTPDIIRTIRDTGTIRRVLTARQKEWNLPPES